MEHCECCGGIKIHCVCEISVLFLRLEVFEDELLIHQDELLYIARNIFRKL